MSAESKQKSWTLVELLNWTSDFLEQKQIENSRLNAELLLGHVLNLSRIQLYVNFDRPLLQSELLSFKFLLKRRLTHEPLQYILGYTEFFSLNFFVGPGVLIPRAETEILVEKVIECCQKNSELDIIKILDIGTGSGNIAVAIAKSVTRANVTAVDASEQALEIAKKNIEYHQMSDAVNLKHCNVYEALPSDLKNFDIIVSNPPYISDSEFVNLPEEILKFEPEQALRGGEHGMDFYHQISKRMSTILNPGGHFFFEIGVDMADPIKSIFNRFHPVIYQDLSGRNRIVTGTTG
ncbi:peptide chain release factor N(5)-glutamine methyltransferase [candidate division KSB1 bacterium]|nr:peptide chain release factor N(5)-glutamine methyltransferase [candidate division KSB1 bacterium]